jgi:hypothetical protein
LQNIANQQCKKWENYDEDFHRREVEAHMHGDDSKNKNNCNMYLLDSKGFVKMLKRYGAAVFEDGHIAVKFVIGVHTCWFGSHHTCMTSSV